MVKIQVNATSLVCRLKNQLAMKYAREAHNYGDEPEDKPWKRLTGMRKPKEELRIHRDKIRKASAPR